MVESRFTNGAGPGGGATQSARDAGSADDFLREAKQLRRELRAIVALEIAEWRRKLHRATAKALAGALLFLFLATLLVGGAVQLVLGLVESLDGWLDAPGSGSLLGGALTLLSVLGLLVLRREVLARRRLRRIASALGEKE